MYLIGIVLAIFGAFGLLHEINDPKATLTSPHTLLVLVALAAGVALVVIDRLVDIKASRAIVKAQKPTAAEQQAAATLKRTSVPAEPPNAAGTGE